MATGEEFDLVAAEYDAARPGYSDSTLDAYTYYADLRQDDKVAELGAGTGHLTQALLKRGLQVVAVEPGDALRGILVHNLNRYTNVGRLVVRSGTFQEEYERDKLGGAGIYDGVAVGTAWKWLGEQEFVMRAVHSLLRPQTEERLAGSVGIMHNTTAVSDGQDIFFGLSRPIYETYMSEVEQSLPDPEALQPVPLDPALFDRVYFGVQVRDEIFDAESYLRLINTYGPIIALDEQVRAYLNHDLRRFINEDLNGEVAQSYATTLTVARRIN